MTLKAGMRLVGRNIARHRAHFVFGSVGLIVGSATLVFFLALSAGIRERVLNRLYPVNQVEFQAETVRLFGLGVEVPVRLDDVVIHALSRLPGVTAVYPKQRTKFPAVLWGGRDVLGYEARLEAFFDGIAPVLVRDEMKAAEAAVLGPEWFSTPCRSDEECGPMARCVGGTCKRKTYWDAFQDNGWMFPCRGDDSCPKGLSCANKQCVVRCDGSNACPTGYVCDRQVCAKACATDSSCMPGEICVSGVCRRLRCRLPSAEAQVREDFSALRGVILPFQDAPDIRLPDGCPDETYCAAANLLSRDGVCEAPIPVVLSPFLLEVYNTVAATAMGLRRLSGLEVLLGVRFAMKFGESYFVNDEAVERRIVKQARIVGFTRKAMEFGVTAPIDAVIRANAAMRGQEEASQYTSVIVETERNEDIPVLVEDARVLGLTLAPRSEEGRKAANVLLVLTIVFAMVSLIILGISAINITHTFLMLVTERRQEIAVYRAIGATLRDIRLMVLSEAGVLGFFGGVCGILVAWACSRGANALASGLLLNLSGAPLDFFVFSLPVIAAGIACSIMFSLVGAFLPANRAAHTDPAVVLAQG